VSLLKGIENHPVLTIFSCIGIGFGAYFAIMQAAGLDAVPRNRYILRDDLDKGYVRRDEVQQSGISPEELKRDYISRETLAANFIEKQQCDALTRVAKEKRDSVENGGPAPPSMQAQVPANVSPMATYESDSYSVKITSAEKRGDAVLLGLTFENLKAERIYVGWSVGSLYGDYLYLIDENGERWYEEGGDRAGVITSCDRPHGTELLPNARLRTELTFRAKGDHSGKHFTLAVKECSPRNKAAFSVGEIVLGGGGGGARQSAHNPTVERTETAKRRGSAAHLAALTDSSEPWIRLRGFKWQI
jgi:hypothetical protein